MSTYDQSTHFDSPLVVTGLSSDVGAFAAAHGIEAELQTMLAVTRDIFGDAFKVVVEEDAEDADDVHLVFEIKAAGEVDAVLRLESEWHRRCIKMAPRAMMFFRLFVDIQ